MTGIVVYTCIVGGIDRLIRQPAGNGIRYICFTDRAPSYTAGWEICPLISPAEISSPRLINRYHKVLCYDVFPGATESIYLDGNVALLAPPTVPVRLLRENAAVIAAPPHDARSTVADELVACARKLSSGQVADAKRLIDMQLGEGFPDNLGLSANYFLVRKTRDEKLRRSMERWWQAISTYVERDQLSLQHSLWAEDVKLLMLNESLSRAPIARRLKHGASGLSLLGRLQNWRQKRHLDHASA